ncbi:MAG: CocE/NonD family hydrolase [bacterium]
MTKSTGNYPSPVPPSSDRVKINQVIVVQEGIELLADLYIPAGKPPFPAVIEITPYGTQGLCRLGEIYATRGYLFLAVDCRGRYRSSGGWSPLTHDQKDGHAVIRWMASHKLCNGKVGTRGHSYSGYNQLLAAIDAPAELQAMVVGVAPGDPFENVPFQGGAYDLNDLFWLLSMTGRVCLNGYNEGGEEENEEENELNDEEQSETISGAAANPGRDTSQDSRDESQKEREEEELDLLFDQALLARPFRDIDLRFGIRQDAFREWISHWQLDDFWKARSVGPRLDRTKVPTLFISGWWDGNGRGSTAFFKGMRKRAATPKVREAQRLLIGAWDHDLYAPDCDDLPEEESRMIHRASARNSLNDELAWFDAHLLGIKPGPSTASRVTLYLTGIYRWLNFTDWPPPETQTAEYYLIGGGKAAGKGAGKSGGAKKGKGTGKGAGMARKSGRLWPAIPKGTGPKGAESSSARSSGAGPSSAGSEESSYLFDPDDPTPFAHPDVDGERIPFDNAAIEEERDDILIFNTAEMEKALALVGELSLILYARADAPDFDLCAKLLDVYPDGRAIYLADGIIRARFRKGWDRPEPVAPSEISEYTIDLWHIGHIVRPGHALRLEISSAASMRFDINPCTGGSLADETKARPVRVTIMHSPDYPSRLILPVCRDPRLSEEEQV